MWCDFQIWQEQMHFYSIKKKALFNTGLPSLSGKFTGGYNFELTASEDAI